VVHCVALAGTYIPVVLVVPMSSELGTCKTVKAEFWPWLSGKSILAFFMVFSLRSQDALQGYLTYNKTHPHRTLP
jgi:hypothetical protein